jgi:hypothetical protein
MSEMRDRIQDIRRTVVLHPVVSASTTSARRAPDVCDSCQRVFRAARPRPSQALRDSNDGRAGVPAARTRVRCVRSARMRGTRVVSLSCIRSGGSDGFVSLRARARGGLVRRV